jgi:hypothetical protein
MMRVVVGFLVVSLLLGASSCDIPKDAYDQAVQEKTAAEEQLAVAQAELKALKDKATVPAGPVADPVRRAMLDQAKAIFNFESLRAQTALARTAGNEAEAKRLDAQALTVLKTFDQTVVAIGDKELSAAWAAMWPDSSRQWSETNQKPGYVPVGYVQFLNRLSVLLKPD